MLNGRQSLKTYNITNDVSIQLVEIPKLKNFSKYPQLKHGSPCNYCGQGNFWNEPWPAALALSRYLAERFPRERLKGCQALIIGCGAGLEGMVLAKLGANVSFQDHVSDALQIVSQNCLLNDIDSFQTICCCWEDSKNVQNMGKYDLVIGSDVLYDPQEWIWIQSLLKYTLKSNELALFSDSMRFDLMNFFCGLSKASFQLKWVDSGWAPIDQWALIYCLERL